MLHPDLVDRHTLLVVSVQVDKHLHEQRTTNESKIREKSCSWKHEACTDVVSDIHFFLFPLRLKRDNKAIGVLTFNTSFVFVFFPLYPTVSHHRRRSLRPPTSHLKNYPSKTNKTRGTLQEKKVWTHKWRSSIDLYTWTYMEVPVV